MLMRSKFSFLYEFWKKVLSDVDCVFAYFCDRLKNNFGCSFEAPLKEELYILSILTIGPNGHADAKRKILVKLKILEKFFFFLY